MAKKTFAFLLLGLAFWSCAAWGADALRLKTSSEVQGAAIRLSDVFDGLPEGKDQDIAVAPAPGKSVTYDARVLARLAQGLQLDWQPQSLGDRSVLTRAARRITPEMIRAALEEKIREVEPKSASGAEVVFDSRFVGFALPSESPAEVTVSGFDYDPQARRFRADVAATGAGGQPIHQNVSGRLLIKRDVPVLAKRLAAGSTVGERDLTWQTVADERLATDIVTDQGQIVGQELRTDHGEGDMLRVRDLIPPRLVSRGALVALKIETPFMQIATQGRAMQDGAKGEVVRVTNVQSNRVIEGTVVAAGVVRVATLKTLASAE